MIEQVKDDTLRLSYQYDFIRRSIFNFRSGQMVTADIFDAHGNLIAQQYYCERSACCNYLARADHRCYQRSFIEKNHD